MGDRLTQYLKNGVINNIEVYGDGSMTITVYVEGKTFDLQLNAEIVNYDGVELQIELEQVVTSRNKVHL